MPNTSDRTCEPVASKVSSNMKDLKLTDDLEIIECGSSLLEGKKCHLVMKCGGDVVAYGTIVSGGPNIVINHAPLGEGNFSVAIDVVLEERAELPIKDVLGQREKFKNVEFFLPIPCKYVYSYVVRLMAEDESIPIHFDQEMFRRPESERLLRDDILHFMEMREIDSRQILTYMGYLYKYLKDKNRTDDITFVDPKKLTNGVGKEGSTMSQHIASQLKEGSRDSICLIPYNTGYHWILTVINEEKNMIYVLDSMGNRNREEAWKNIVTNGVKIYNAGNGIPNGPGFKQLTGNLKQRGGVECGYCVMLYMKEIVESEGVQLEKKYGGSAQ